MTSVQFSEQHIAVSSLLKKELNILFATGSDSTIFPQGLNKPKRDSIQKGTSLGAGQK